jgi:hypothetical protein
MQESEKDRNDKTMHDLKKYGSPTIDKNNRTLFKSYITGSHTQYNTNYFQKQFLSVVQYSIL